MSLANETHRPGFEDAVDNARVMTEPMWEVIDLAAVDFAHSTAANRRHRFGYLCGNPASASRPSLCH